MSNTIAEYFPFKKIREGQRQFLDDLNRVFSQKGLLLAYAPTGIGKTAAALSGGLTRIRALDAMQPKPTTKEAKALRRKKRLLFLTSRHMQHRIAIESLQKLAQKGHPVKVVDIISKQAMCLNEGVRGTGAEFNLVCRTLTQSGACPYYQADNKKVIEMLDRKVMAYVDLMDKCDEVKVCPHKAALGAAKECDVLIADYNVVFSDMRDAFFDRMGATLEDVVLVVDEAHNLPERIMENMSLDIDVSFLEDLVTELKGKAADIAVPLRPLIAWLEDEVVGMSSEERKVETETFMKLVEKNLGLFKMTYARYVDRVKEFIETLSMDEESFLIVMIERYRDFLVRWRDDPESSLRYVSRYDNTIALNVRPLDVAALAGRLFSQVDSAVLMSATLYPQEQYIDKLGLEKDRAVGTTYDSPFPPENRCLLAVPGVTSVYKERGPKMFSKYAAFLMNLKTSIPGNLATFFPSYEFLKEVYFALPERARETVFFEERASRNKSDLLQHMRTSQKRGGSMFFLVFGGSFSEGVDFADNLLSGVAIAGFPYPPPSFTLKELQAFYEARHGKGKGFHYASTLPAINKVIQAAGRCIRSETDRGLIALLDDRFTDHRTLSNFPSDFKPRRSISPWTEAREFFGR